MTGEIQAPIARKDFQEWAGGTYRLYENIRQTDGSVLGCTRYELLPEVRALFVGDPKNRKCIIRIGKNKGKDRVALPATK